MAPFVPFQDQNHAWFPGKSANRTFKVNNGILLIFPNWIFRPEHPFYTKNTVARFNILEIKIQEHTLLPVFQGGSFVLNTAMLNFTI